jgi:hypothetical protein
VTKPIPADSAREKLDRGLGKVEGIVRGLGARPIGRGRGVGSRGWPWRLCSARRKEEDERAE